jgi:SAM-dependent methyltransferase
VQCIGHLIDTQGFFEEARRVLLPGGTLLLSTGLRRPWHRKRHAMRHRLYWAARPLIDVWRGRQPVEPVWRWPAHGLWCLCSGSRRFWLETRGYADHTWQGLARFGETAQLELIRAVGITEQATCHEWFPERSGLPHLPQCRVAVAAWRKPSA